MSSSQVARVPYDREFGSGFNLALSIKDQIICHARMRNNRAYVIAKLKLRHYFSGAISGYFAKLKPRQNFPLYDISLSLSSKFFYVIYSLCVHQCSSEEEKKEWLQVRVFFTILSLVKWLYLFLHCCTYD